VFADYFGDVIDLTKQADRQRLDIVHNNGLNPVPFLSPNPTMVTFTKMITNEGCAPLQIDSLVADEVSNGVAAGVGAFTGIRNDLLNRSNNLADRLTGNASKISKVNMLREDWSKVTSRESGQKYNINMAAAATPFYLNQRVYGPFTLNPGDTIPITVSVNGPLVSRGPHPFYMQVWSNDPDYFMANTGGLVPQITLTLVGGCLIDTTELHFGTSGNNHQLVTNTGRLGMGDWNPTTGPGNFFVDGNGSDFFQGSYVMGVDTHRIALNTITWWTGATEQQAWFSLQGDPNFCDGTCKPALQTGVTLASISTDGVTYTPLLGDMVCNQFIDSVINYGSTGTWNWLAYSSPFDNAMTMGLKTKTKTFGITNPPTAFAFLGNATVQVFEMTERNGVAVPNWKMGAVIDYDMAAGNDTAVLNQSISAGWNCPKGAVAKGDVWGLMKLPFGGCGLAPFKNVVSLNGDQALYKLSSAPGPYFLDSAYRYMKNIASGVGKAQSYSSTDREWFGTLVEHEFAPSETFKFAVAQFGFNQVNTPVNPAELPPLARTLNKLLGFGRGDVNNDGTINLLDIMYLNENVNASGPGAIPFAHLGDVNGDGLINAADVTYLLNYYFNYGPCPVGQWTISF
jgi:hypothetical protein